MNNVPLWVPPGKPLPESGRASVSVPLLHGRNKTELTVVDAAGREGLRQFRIVSGNLAEPHPSLHFVAFGVGRYEDSRLDL